MGARGQTIEDKDGECPCCSGSTKVIDVRTTKMMGRVAIRRRRKCKNCDYRETYYEIPSSIVDKILEWQKKMEYLQGEENGKRDNGGG